MIRLRFDKLAAAVGGTLYNTERAKSEFSGVSIDSRSVTEQQLFVAIRGERLDGHDYVTQALKRGASGLVVEYNYPGLQKVPGYIPVIAVRNSHEAMMQMAARYRNACPATFVGITGSNGKTTTKELTCSLLQAVETDIYRSPGNLNNLFGVPLALFGVPSDCRIAVIELGISTEVEMPRLAAMVHPEMIIITNIGPTHLEFLGSLEAVARAKLEPVSYTHLTLPTN